MFALWACSASFRRIGPASRLSAAECELSCGSRSACTSTMLEPLSITRTWTSPHSFNVTGPSTVGKVVDAVGAVVVVVARSEVVLDATVVVVELDEAGSVVVGAVSVDGSATPLGAGDVWKFASSASTPPVAARTGTARRTRPVCGPVISERGTPTPPEPFGLFHYVA